MQVGLYLNLFSVHKIREPNLTNPEREVSEGFLNCFRIFPADCPPVLCIFTARLTTSE
jgi:hypothetical protein